MRVGEARALVLERIAADLRLVNAPMDFDDGSPDGDPGKFVLARQPARAIHHYDGWYVPINLNWFA